MENLAEFIAQNHSGPFRMYFVKFKKKLVVKNCDLGLESAALGLRPAFSRPRSQFFTIRTSQPVNNIYISLWLKNVIP